jgi:hypothetical protein
MKRCPHCNFIFPDADELCDFDKTPLIAIAENEIDSNAVPVPGTVEVRRQNRKALLMASVVGISLGLILFVVYHSTHRQSSLANQAKSQQNNSPRPALAIVNSTAEPSPIPVASPSVQQTANYVAKAAPSPAETAAHAKVSARPVSTGTEAKNVGSGGKSVIIRLTSGGKVEADEVWRTKEGVWYRRDGMVTLLKSNRVKAIVNP